MFLLGLLACGPAHRTAGADAGAPPPPPPTYRNSLSLCWHDLFCQRAFIISHGGDWNVGGANPIPYDSMAAFQRAYANGADGIKADFRVTKDGVPVVAHSSPIEFWESMDCAGDKIEDMTAAQVTACHLFPSTTETYQRVGDVLDWAKGKLVVMLTVKDQNFAAAIQTILAHEDQDGAFIEVRLADLQSIVPQAPDHDKVWFNAELSQQSDIPTLLALNNPRVMMAELDNYDMATVTEAITSQIHPAGMRAFVMGMGATSESQQEALYNLGFDIVMSYALTTGVQARETVNMSRGVSPP